MKKNFLFPAVIAFVILFSACQKEPDNNLPPTQQHLKVKTYTEELRSALLDTFITTFNLNYDGSDRLTSLVDASDPGNKFVFAYPSSSKYTMDLFADNIFVLHADYFLNSHSMLDSSFQYSNTDSITEKYVYNPAHQLTKLYEYDYSKVTGSDLWNTTTYTYDGAGNLVKSEDTDDYVYTYEYYTDKLVLSPQVMPFAGSNQKTNLIKKLTLTESGTVTASVMYTYTFDSKDRVSTIRHDYSDGDVVIKTFTYFD